MSPKKTAKRKRKQSKLERLVKKVNEKRMKSMMEQKAVSKTPLSNKDNLYILSYYNINVPKRNGKTDRRKTMRLAKGILADKLCKCIKKLTVKNNGVNDGRIIGLCTKSVFERKGLERGRFTCKRGRGKYLEVFK
jgi:hypothetical protein